MKTHADSWLGRFPKTAPNSVVARILLAFLTSAGLYYVTIMPVFVDALKQDIGLNAEQAGFITATNGYGTALGGLIAVFLVKRINWKPVAFILLMGLISVDLFSLTLSNPEILKATRFLHGIIGGTLIGIGFAAMARTSHPDRSYAILLAVQVGLGGIGVGLLTPLIPTFGTTVVFSALIIFSAVTLLMLPFLSDYTVERTPPKEPTRTKTDVQLKPLLMTLMAIMLFQASNMGLYAFMIGLGESAGQGRSFIGGALAIAAWIGILGSLLVLVFSTRFGRVWPITASMLFTSAGIGALQLSDNAIIFLAANTVICVSWTFILPYLYSMCAELDKSGQMATLGGFASKMGLASGPLAAGMILGESTTLKFSEYNLVINTALATLIICLFFAIYPSHLLDRKN